MRLRPISLIARREFKERTRSRTFRITLALMVLAVLASAIVPLLTEKSGTAKPYVIASNGPLNTPLVAALNRSQTSIGPSLKFDAYPSDEEARNAVRNHKADVYLAPNVGVFVATEPTAGLAQPVFSSADEVASVEQQTRALGTVASSGTSNDQLVAAINTPQLKVQGLAAAPPRNTNDVASSFPAFILLFVFLTLGGAFILNGVIEEKSSRVVEILLATVTPSELLVGKIVGIGAVGVTQGVVISAATLATRSVSTASSVAGSGPISLRVILLALMWFVLAFALYSGMYACAGALVSRSEDAQNLVFPLQLPLLVSFITALSAATFTGPSTALNVMSFIPFTAPMTMLERMAAQQVAWWEVLVSVSLTAITSVIVIKLAAIIFSGGILRSGQRVKLRDAWSNSAARG